jgi:hypothetical protein
MCPSHGAPRRHPGALQDSRDVPGEPARGGAALPFCLTPFSFIWSTPVGTTNGCGVTARPSPRRAGGRRWRTLSRSARPRWRRQRPRRRRRAACWTTPWLTGCAALRVPGRASPLPRDPPLEGQYLPSRPLHPPLQPPSPANPPTTTHRHTMPRDAHLHEYRTLRSLIVSRVPWRASTCRACSVARGRRSPADAANGKWRRRRRSYMLRVFTGCYATRLPGLQLPLLLAFLFLNW